MVSPSPHSDFSSPAPPPPDVSVMTASRGTVARATLTRPPGPQMEAWPPPNLPATSSPPYRLVPAVSAGFMAHRAAMAPMGPQRLLTVPEPLLQRRGSEPLVPGLRPEPPVWAAPRSGGALWSRANPPTLAFGAVDAESPRPAIVPAPTLGVVPLMFQSPHGPQAWPPLHLRLGELSYLLAYPGDKRRDSCTELLRTLGLGPIDGMGYRDISVVQGSRHVPWLLSPTVARGAFLKMRYAVDVGGRWCAALEASSSESVLRLLRREVFGRGMLGMEMILDRMSEGEEPLDGMTARLNRTVTVQHFAHSLVLGELFCGQEVLDVINCDGKLLGLVPLRAHPGASRLLALPQPLRKTLARSLLLSLSKLLRDMHEREVVHHNVCLDNVLLSPSRTTLSGLLSAHASAARGMPSERTPTHVPPEMALWECGSGRATDVWGLGMALMRLLCGSQAFVVAADVAHERGLTAGDWRAYIDWHRMLLAPRGPSGTAPLLQTPLQRQLKQGYAAASTTDAELATFLVHRLLVPSSRDRLQGDHLVSAAAALSRGTSSREARALDELIANNETGLSVPERGDVLARMGQLLPRWQHVLQQQPSALGQPF